MNLKKPKNFRPKFARLCNFCKHYRSEGDGCWYCIRDKENFHDANDRKQYEHVCDYFTEYKP